MSRSADMRSAHSARGAPVALVTGASRRIGRAIALEFAAAGYRVALHHHMSAAAAGNVVQEIAAAGGSAYAFAAELRTAAGARALAATVLGHLGRVDVLVNNASRFTATPLDAPAGAAFDDAVAALCGVHVAAPLALVHALAPSLAAGGCGAVVNLGDARHHRAHHAAYLAAKAALASLTRSLARDLAPRIRVNMVAPGSILPAAGAPPDATASLISGVPLGRLGTTSEVARAVRFLACGPAFITGQILAVDGGQYA